MSDEVLDLNEADFSFAQGVASRPGGEGLRNCFACGSCSAACPVLPHVAGFDPRRLIRLVLLGQREEVLTHPLIWFCSTCYSCHEVCPQKVSFTEIGFVLRNMATEEGYFPPAFLAQIDLLRTHGRLYEIGEFENGKRVKMGLPEIAEAPADFQTLLSKLAGMLKPGPTSGQEGE